nr:hypothetical protein [Lachnospiraceae bacterium]
CYPHLQKGEGQFMAYFRKPAGEAPALISKKRPPISPNALKLLAALAPYVTLDKARIFEDDKHRLWLTPAGCISLPSRGITMPGVQILDPASKPDRPVPHHQLFKAGYKYFGAALDISAHPEMAAAYIKGLELDLSNLPHGQIPNKAYVPVMYRGFCLGGGRTDRDRLKNLYPKGLRESC